MQSKNANAIAHSADTSSDESVAGSAEQTPSLSKYIQNHKLPGAAANDPHKLALAEFLYEHMKRRADAQPEST